MPFNQVLATFKDLDLTQAELSLWVFKKRVIDGNAANGTVKFTAHWVKVADGVKTALKEIIGHYQKSYIEVEPYTLLAQNNENSFLGVQTNDTTFAQLKGLVDLPAEEHQATSEKHLNNALGYVARLKLNNQTLYCVKKANANWKTKTSSSLLNLIFTHQELDIVPNPAFSLERSVDFFVLGDTLLTPSKAAFESLLSYKEGYKLSFNTMCLDPQFSSQFVTLQPLVDFVGANSIQLRRMATIEHKGLYKNHQFMAQLIVVNSKNGWNIQFDAQGRIDPTPATVKAIMNVLLDHRLYSELTHTTYDVPSAVPV